MQSDLPADALIVLVGAAGSGKSAWALDHLRPTQILSSDAFRGMVADDDRDQSATDDAFELLELTAAKRLARGLLTLIDATNVEAWTRFRWIDLAARHRRPSVAVAFDVPLETLLERNARRETRAVSSSVVKQQARQMRTALRGLEQEGFTVVIRGA
ncbi:MAG: AAA family ATPase [Candidatus Limnocylindria bacterium]